MDHSQLRSLHTTFYFAGDLVYIFSMSFEESLKSIVWPCLRGLSQEIFNGLLGQGLLASEDLTEQPEDGPELERTVFSSKEDLITYIAEVFPDASPEVFYDKGLWSWISAYFFDSVCPVEKDGRRHPGAAERHIPNVQHWGRYYRHLIAAPYRLKHELGALAGIYLTGLPNRQGDLFEQLASTQEIATCRGIIEAASEMYYEQDQKRIKKGAVTQNKPGNVRRFARAIIPQFQLTYDLNTMSGKQIIQLLPSEFNSWLKD